MQSGWKKEPLIEKVNAENDVKDKSRIRSDCWELKELVSRDGQAKLKASVFFASFDQRTLATVIVHWLQSNQNFMPTASQFDSLIAEGSSEWCKLCNDQSYMNSFPDNHFNLETFENLKGAKSFDDIWKELSSSTEAYDQRIYIETCNDHFFVLKADADAFYIIDSLGERLFEGCNQAYILKFDESSVMYWKVVKEEADSNETVAAAAREKPKDVNEESADIVCKGKDCGREFIKRFLAAITLKELEEEEKMGKIDFHYCSSSTSSSSSFASPTSSQYSSDECSN
ncbi:hypothetical protein MANES_16G122200v8 [Manihot esculenta]|uniref:Uncharacterized protein n=1 Tax=Manihot esculenta TaxID=3983 RepID=A0ACB7G931_MANES|nr:hypothetical protein MANES_16G122200v8 [Manihot esculenta]